MPDGTKLWGCMTYPEAINGGEKFPALLVMDPYAGDCSLTYYYEGALARRGYVVVYVHVRGSGRSEGVFFDREYSRQELDDAVEVINWLARQRWSTGKVGMYGWSWSGFNALQVAMKKPTPLKAIIANVATENLYHEDVHYADGIFRYGPYNIFADVNLIYTPPPLNPENEALLNQRFDQPPLSLTYLRHQNDGPFWRPDIRLNHHPDTLAVPTYMLGGWYDGYRSAILRTLKRSVVPAKAVIGPWEHSLETPEPTADLAKLMLRWWDYWLKGKDTGVMNDPDLIAYLRAPYRPTPATSLIPGQWQAVHRWPPETQQTRTYYFGNHQELTPQPAEADTLRHRFVPSVGSEAGIWWGNVLADQQHAQAYDLLFETEPFSKEQAMLGQPDVTLFVSAPVQHANWVVRLSDVAPDGSVTHITGGAINGTHRESSVTPAYLLPGKRYELNLRLHFTSWILKPGHRLRVSVSNGIWPMFWPTPYPMITSLYIGDHHLSAIQLPFIDLASAAQATMLAQKIGSRNVSMEEVQNQKSRESVVAEDWNGPDKIIREPAEGKTTVIYRDADRSSNPSTASRLTYTVRDADPAHARVEGTSTITLQRDNDTFSWEGRTTIRSDSVKFYYHHARMLRKNGDVIRRNMWNETIERKFQ